MGELMLGVAQAKLETKCYSVVAELIQTGKKVLECFDRFDLSCFVEKVPQTIVLGS